MARAQHVGIQVILILKASVPDIRLVAIVTVLKKSEDLS